MDDYTDFKILLDDPAVRPGLGFDHYASALADVIVSSTPRFAVGIFGGWGSGKTTLMRAIEYNLQDRSDVVPVWFNAWRYEREPHLIVPLLDVLRESLAERASVQPPSEASRALRAARAVARAGRALLAGVTLSAGVAGVEAQLEPGKVIDALADSDPEDGAGGPLSFYEAAFVMLREAIDDFSESGARRVVVFIDDLDRCLPANALEVLESMKLFFDLEGFIFVAGLDQDVVERAVAHKYRAASGDSEPAVNGAEYIKKIFQVPFALPRIGTNQLNEYLSGIAASDQLSPRQRSDFNKNVRRHLEFLRSDDSVNPREVKRLLNAYTMQLKMLSSRLEQIDPNVVLALQCMSFRADWEDLYEFLVTDPPLFQQAVKAARAGKAKEDVVWLSGKRVTLPPSFVRYVDSRASSLLTAPHLELYVSAAESGRSTDPSVLEAYGILAKLRREVEGLPNLMTPAWFAEMTDSIREVEGSRVAYVSGSSLLTDLIETLRMLIDTIRRVKATQRGELDSRVARIEKLVESFPLIQEGDRIDRYRQDVKDWVNRADSMLDGVDTALRELRRQTIVGARSSS